MNQFPIFEELGFNEREAQVYETLLRLGECPVADILEATQLHPQLIYRALDSLVVRGLVIISFRRHRKYARAEDPRVLERIEAERLTKLRKALPDLMALQQGSKDAVVRVEKGAEAVRSHRARLIDLAPEKSNLDIIGGSGDSFFKTMGERLREVERKRIKKGILRRILSFSSQRQLFEENDAFKKLTEYRYLETEYPVPSSTLIYGDKVALYIWTSDPLVIDIESAEAADSYRSYFEALWQVAKP